MPAGPARPLTAMFNLLGTPFFPARPMNHRLTAAALALLALTGCTSAGVLPATGHPDSSGPGWQQLVADDLSNTTLADRNKDHAWVLESPGTWRSDIDRMVFTKETYENFVLDLEFKDAPGTNGGVILYCSDPANWVPNSIEVQVADDFDPKWSADPKTRCSSFYGRQPAVKFLVKKPGEWNHYTITCVGKEVQVRLNGETVNQFNLARFTDAKVNPDGSKAPAWLSKPPAGLPTKGHIGFQGKHGAAPVWYRNIRIHPLTDAEIKALPVK